MPPKAADITVIIPSFDRTHLALETVRSVFDQDWPVREVIVVANGSDEHAAFWDAHAGGKIRVLRVPSLGKQIARNEGIRAAHSEWVATLDDDDLYCPNFIRSVIPAITDGKADIVGTDHRKFHPHREDRRTNFEAAPMNYWAGLRPDPAVEWSFVGRFPLELLLKRVPIYPSTTVIRREFALRIGGYNPAMRGIMSEDLEFLIRALTHGNLALVWRPLVRYRKHPGNDTASELGRAIGRLRIFEFARENHEALPASFRRAIERDLPRRRRQLFRLACAAGDLAAMDAVWAEMTPDERRPGLMFRKYLAGRKHARKAKATFRPAARIGTH